MLKVLVAEDERDILELITFTLQFGGYEVIPTTNGTDALEMTFKEHPDLVLLDVRMPRMSGYDVCTRVKTDPRTENIPIVFISAKGQEAEIKTGFEAGAIDYILKPFAPDYLLNRLKEILANEAVISDY